MKLSTRSRYGTRLLLDMAQHYDQGPLHLAQVAQRQGISVKYLEQIIIPLKKAGYVASGRGPKGGHLLAKPPEAISVGEIVSLLEDGASLVECSDHPGVCGRANRGITWHLWKEASQAMFDRLQAISFADLVKNATPEGAGEGA